MFHRVTLSSYVGDRGSSTMRRGNSGCDCSTKIRWVSLSRADWNRYGPMAASSAM